jgi:hypothetical protein
MGAGSAVLLPQGKPACGCLDVRAGPEFERLGLGAVALRYQRMGLRVLALAPRAKRPHKLFTHGVHWATTNPAMVEAVYPENKSAGIGVATGLHRPESRAVVVADLDCKSGHDGATAFASFLNENRLQIPYNAPVVSTPSGGWHIWMALPPGLALPGRTGILPGVDIKAGDGYVVVPPTHIEVESMDDGRALLPYRWVSGCPCTVPPAPGWLIDWVQNTPGTGHGSGGEGSGEPVPDLGELAQTGLPVGERNRTAHRLACSLFRKYGTGPAGEAAVRTALQPVLAATDKRGLSEREISTAINSAHKFITARKQQEQEAWEAMRAAR